MNKSKNQSLSSSVGFKSQGSGFAATLKKDSWQPQPKQMSSTQKDMVMRKATANVQRNEERRHLIQNYLEQNVDNEMDFQTTTNLQNYTAQRPRTADQGRQVQPNHQQNPFHTRTFTKTINLLVEEFDGSEINFQNQKFIERQQSHQANKPPGVLSLRKFNYGNAYKMASQRDPVVMIQALARRYLQRKKYLVLRKQFTNTIHENKMTSAADRMVRGELFQADQLITQLEKQKIVDLPQRTFNTNFGIDRENPFYTTMLEILGERGMLGQDDFIHTNKFENNAPPSRPPLPRTHDKKQSQVKLRPHQKKNLKVKIHTLEPVLKSDGLELWAAMHKKQGGRAVSKALSYEDDEMLQSISYDEPKTRQIAQQDKRQQDRDHKIKKAMALQTPKDVRVRMIDEDIGEDIVDITNSGVLDEDIKPEDDEISEDVYLEEEFEAQSESGGIKESILDSGKRSDIRESFQIKESIQESYQDDFEQASQSYQKKLPRTSRISKDSEDVDQYNEEGFESYSEQKSDSNTKKKVTFDNEKSSPPRLQTIIVQEVETQPIQYIKSKWEKENNNQVMMARKEAEFQLGKFQEKYKELRTLKFDDVAFEGLKQEHYDYLKVENNLQVLLNGNGQTKASTKEQQEPMKPMSGQADLLFSKFQFEFHRLLSVNTLGTKLQNIIGSIGVFDKKNPTSENENINSGLPIGIIQKALYSIEQQQIIVQQVLQQVLAQMSSMFEDQQALAELRLYRQESDQKLQQLLFKQDKLLNDRMEAQLRKRDVELRKFIQDQFDRQRREFGSVKLVPSSKLQDALQKSFQAFQPNFSAPYDPTSSTGKLQEFRAAAESVKDDDSSYQPDFESASEQSQRIKTESEFERDQNSLSGELEVNEYGNIEDSEDQLKERQAQDIVDYLTSTQFICIREMLLDEIKQDFFPLRDEEGSQPIIQEKEKESPLLLLPLEKKVKKPVVETKKVEQILEEKPKIIAQKQIVEEDDFGMGTASFSRQDLEKEFDLTDDLTMADDKNTDKKPELKIDVEYQKFVSQILEKYAKLLKSKKSKLVEKLLSLLHEVKTSDQSLGGLIQRDFHFFKPQEIKEKDAQPIVHSFEEQIANNLLEAYNDAPKQSKRATQVHLTDKVDRVINQAMAMVLKITEKLVPVDYYPEKKMEFEGVYNYAKKNVVPKECLPNYEIQDNLIATELDNLGDDLHHKLLQRIVEDTIEEFSSISKKRKNKK